MFLSQKSDERSVCLNLEHYEGMFKATNNPVYAIIAFHYAYAQQCPIPAWTIEFVVVSFHDYLESDGTKSIEECFQLKLKKGETPRFKLVLLEERDQFLMIDMHKLVAWLGLSTEEAAHMVKAKLDASDWNKTHVELKDLSEETILGMYKKSHRKTYNNSMALFGLNNNQFTPEQRSEFVSSFPAHATPEKLKSVI